MSETVFPDARPFPVNLRVSDKPVLVVGAGNVAVRKVGQLLASGADVTVVGPRVDPRLYELSRQWSHLPEASDAVRAAGSGSLSIEARRYATGEVASYMLAITCTDDPAVNARVHDDGTVAGVWVNSADDPKNCEFTLPSVVRSGDLQITVSTEGRSPALAMWLRQRFEREFGPEWAELLDLLAEVRSEVRDTYGTSEVEGWLEALDSIVADWIRDSDVEAARRTLRGRLGLLELEAAQ